jgi:hypothetical protein
MPRSGYETSRNARDLWVTYPRRMLVLIASARRWRAGPELDLPWVGYETYQNLGKCAGFVSKPTGRDSGNGCHLSPGALRRVKRATRWIRTCPSACLLELSACATNGIGLRDSGHALLSQQRLARSCLWGSSLHTRCGRRMCRFEDTSEADYGDLATGSVGCLCVTGARNTTGKPGPCEDLVEFVGSEVVFPAAS